MAPVTAQTRKGLGVVLLAAGRSTRMGRPKLLLPWGRMTVLGYLLEQWRALGAEQIAVVHAADDRAVQAELDRLGCPGVDRVPNPAPERGMFSSIQCAARWTGWHPSLTHWALVLGDQPHLRAETLRAVLESGAAQPEKICQPACAGRRGHPVSMPRPFFEELAVASDETLKQFLSERQASVAVCEVADPGLGLDLDRPEDYQSALKLAPPTS